MKKNNKRYALKEMSKVRIIDRHSEKSIRGERDFLSILLHPFIVNMVCSFQDYENLYLVMDLLTGGDLRYHLCKIRHFSEEETKFFIACLLLGLEYIHNKNIIHRDIKPENLVSDEKGYIRITDFGVAKIRKEDNSSETSGTPGYMAPEVLMAQNHSFPVDFFAIGIMGYEFMMGERPYLGKTRKEIKHLVLKKQAKIEKEDIPDGWSLESVDFINKCLKRKESRRLGYNRGISELKNHPWFQGFDWDSLFNKTMEAPFIPKKTGNYDKKYCEVVEKISDTTLERYHNYKNDKNYKHVFDGYTCINIELIQNSNICNETNTNHTWTKSNKLSGKTNSSTKADLMNKLQLNTNELSNKKLNKKKDREKKILSEKNPDKEKIDILHQLDFNSFIEKEKEKNKENNDKDIKQNFQKKKKNKDENSSLSLQTFLNYTKRNRIKFTGLSKNIYSSKEGKLSNLSDLEPSIINNFKKLDSKFNEKNQKMRSSSVCYSSNNNDNHNRINSNNNKIKDINNKGKTLEMNKIQGLYHIFNLNHKGSLTGKNVGKNKKINFKGFKDLSPYKSPLVSPKNSNKDNLILQYDFNKINIENRGILSNRRPGLHLPNLLKEKTLSPTFRNALKIKKRLKINVEIMQNLKKLKEKKQKNNNNINYKRLLNNKKNDKMEIKKRNDSANLINRFVYNNKKIKTREKSAKREKNLSENKSKLGENYKKMYGTERTKKLKHNFSALNIQ